jgi:serine/threonine protein kinase
MAQGARKRVVAKWLRPNSVDRLVPAMSTLEDAMLNEASVLHRFRNHRAPRLQEVLWLDGRLCLIMDCIPAPTVQSALADAGMLSWAFVQQLSVQVLDALSELHDIGWLHGDLNPGNLLHRDGQVFIVDFGAARLLGLSTRDPWPLGRHRYMAPEHLVFGRSRSVGPEADIHQVACLMLHLLSGREPFRQAKDAEDYLTVYLVRLKGWMSKSSATKLRQYEDLRVSGRVPVGLFRVLADALHPDASRRLTSASIFSKQIAAL